jgi:hypothetical protein
VGDNLIPLGGKKVKKPRKVRLSGSAEEDDQSSSNYDDDYTFQQIDESSSSDIDPPESDSQV